MLAERGKITRDSQVLLAPIVIDNGKVKAKVLLRYASDEIKKYAVNHKLSSQLKSPKSRESDRLFIKRRVDEVIRALQVPSLVVRGG